MRIFTLSLVLSVLAGPVLAASSLDVAIGNVRSACGAISDELAEMKTHAGIGTAVSAVGTVTGGVALGTGIAKANVDDEIARLQAAMDKIASLPSDGVQKLELTEQNKTEIAGAISSYISSKTDKNKNNSQQLSELEQKSKRLGNIRTGTLATSTAANIAGAVVAGTNRVAGDLQQKINACIESVSELSRVRMQARLDGDTDAAQLARAERIISECGAWETVNVASIDKRAKGATVSSGIGAGLGLVGTITSASANSQPVRDGDATKENNLNTAANVLAGGTTLASGAATVFNATQIAAIKRASDVADMCEGALK